MSPHRGAVFKQRPQCFGRGCWVGHTWGDRYWSEILVGDPPPDAKAVDWAAVEAMARKKIPAALTYELAWGSPRRAGGTEKVRFSFKTAPVSTDPPG
jgi:hypothetical protein